MAKTKYDVGDILTLCKDGECYATAVIVRWHTKDIHVEGVSLERRTDYDLFVKSEEKDNFEFVHDVPECLFLHWKAAGHIDISGMPNDEVKTHLDRAIKTKWYKLGIFHVIEAYWSIMKLKEPDMHDKFEKVGPMSYMVSVVNEDGSLIPFGTVFWKRCFLYKLKGDGLHVYEGVYKLKVLMDGSTLESFQLDNGDYILNRCTTEMKDDDEYMFVDKRDDDYALVKLSENCARRIKTLNSKLSLLAKGIILGEEGAE